MHRLESQLGQSGHLGPCKQSWQMKFMKEVFFYSERGFDRHSCMEFMHLMTEEENPGVGQKM